MNARIQARFAPSALIAALFLAACANPLRGPLDSGSAEPGQADRVAISISAASSRIVMPDAPAIARYRLFGARAGGDRQSLGTWTSLTGATATIQTGTWDFRLDAYDASDKLVLEGAIGGKTVDAAASLSFHLAPLASGTGSVAVGVSWYASSAAVASVEASLDGRVVATIIPKPFMTSSMIAVYAADQIPAGDYLLNFRLLNSAGAVLAVRSEWLLVRKDLESVEVISIDSAGFDKTPAAPDIQSIATGAVTWHEAAATLTWKDNAFNETGFIVRYSDDGGQSWQSSGTLPQTQTSYAAVVPRGVTRSFRVVAVNAIGESSPAAASYAAPAQFAITGADPSVSSFRVNLWDPATLRLRDTILLARSGESWAGSLEPSVPGNLLVQAYGYDAAGNIKAVAEATSSISAPGDSVAMAAEAARLMSGNVQKTGHSLGLPVAYTTFDAVGEGPGSISGLTCDGLNLYFSINGGGRVKRMVISSKAVSTFAGSGAGTDADNPGHSPVFEYVGAMATDGRALYLCHSSSARISRISLTADASVFSVLGGGERMLNDITSDGRYLYADNAMIHRLDLSNADWTTLDRSDWSWKRRANVANYYLASDLATDGSRLYLGVFDDGELRSLPVSGGAPSLLTSVGFAGGMTVDGSSLFAFNRRSDSSWLIDILQVDLATGTKALLGTVGDAGDSDLYDTHIATDGASIFGFRQ